LHEDGGDVQRAQAAYEKCLAIRRQQNDLAGVAKTLDNLGLLFTTAGNQDRAKACFDEAQQIRDAR
jgi:tetratricopeptide (TPR) repeat protein